MVWPVAPLSVALQTVLFAVQLQMEVRSDEKIPLCVIQVRTKSMEQSS